jgi:hypothetical protein
MRNNLTKRCSPFVCVMVALAAWQGTLPCAHAHAHSHGTTAHICSGGSACDSEHWDALGSDEVHGTPSPWCWHVHCDLPESDGDSSDIPCQCRSEFVAVDGFSATADVIRESLLVVSHSVAPFDVVLPARCPVIRPDMARSVSSFFATFAAEMSLPVRFGNIRC